MNAKDNEEYEPYQKITLIKFPGKEPSIRIYRRNLNISKEWIDILEGRRNGKRLEKLDCDDTLSRVIYQQGKLIWKHPFGGKFSYPNHWSPKFSYPKHIEKDF